MVEDKPLLTTVLNMPRRTEAASAEWSVYRVRTRGSTYTIGIHQGGGRPFALLTNARFATGAASLREGQDSAPLSGDRPLLSVHYREWIGRTLSVGMITTSPVVSVDPETDNAIITEVTSVSPRTAGAAAALPAANAAPPAAVGVGAASARSAVVAHVPPSYPEQCAIAAERAVHYLSMLCDHPTLFSDVRGSPVIEQRLHASLELASALFQVLAQRSRR
jgi:hypothetical protein